MDIIGSMLAYLVCMSGLVTGLVMSFVVFFSTPNQLSNQLTGQEPAERASAIAAVAQPSSGVPVRQSAVKEFPVQTIARSQQKETSNRPVAANAATAGAAVAADAQQKPLLSPNRMRRLAEKERARHLAYRERSSFEARFLHYDD